MLKSLRKSECPKEITEIVNEAIDRQVIFIIWQSNRGKDQTNRRDRAFMPVRAIWSVWFMAVQLGPQRSDVLF